MAITTAQYKAAVEAKIAAATGSTSLDDLTLIKSNADLWLQNNPGGSITGYSSLESLIQTKQNALTGSSTLDDITLTGVSAFPPVSASAVKSRQSGFVNTFSVSFGTGGTEDAIHFDVAVSSVNTSKCVVSFEGQHVVYNSSNAFAAQEAARVSMVQVGSNWSATFRCSARLLNATTLRVSVPLGFTYDTLSHSLVGRWYVMEFN